MNKDKLILAYSGGLDTSVAIPWLKENYNVEIITVSIDFGMVNLKTITDRALACGAIKAIGVDAKQRSYEHTPKQNIWCFGDCCTPRPHCTPALPDVSEGKTKLK